MRGIRPDGTRLPAGEVCFRKPVPFCPVPPRFDVMLRTFSRKTTGLLSLAVLTVLPAGAQSADRLPTPTRGWIVKTRPQVDLWLHGFALLSATDSALVPLFAPTYRDQVTVAKNARNLFTTFDANADSLRARYARTPQLLQAQFLAFRFADVNDLQQSMDLFVRAEGDPRRAGSREMAEVVAELAAVFPSARERDWARLFAEGLRDEETRFHGTWWKEQQAQRRDVLRAVDSLWSTSWQPAMMRYLSRAQLRSGDIVLGLSLAGEGRASSGRGVNVLAVPFPESTARAADALYVVAHEAVGALAGSVIADNTTPAEQRAGIAARYVSAAQVIAGHELLLRVLPAEADGYARYYLAQRPDGGAVPAAGSAGDALARAFGLPSVIVDALRRQLDITLSGI
jgi:hypothetical protein